MRRGLSSGALLLALALAAGLNGVPAKYAEYAKWEIVADKGLPTGGPHAGQQKVVYANPVAAREWKGGKALPLGSIVVKTTGPASAPTLIAVMEKRAEGWYYEEYLPEAGKYVLKFGGPGKQQLCVGCHTGAKAKDYLFTRP
ncbi:cytochrome P460 family protein [Calidithermus chliarophilus]|uniref:cytochrome P460 family protein n=1 Tax=Calidithermus chliarophilus TaxID=52023 RepID=UPI00040B107C|nr:cytochrome P460 family protein [Calidithermus chliarophilus]